MRNTDLADWVTRLLLMGFVGAALWAGTFLGTRTSVSYCIECVSLWGFLTIVAGVYIGLWAIRNWILNDPSESSEATYETDTLPSDTLNLTPRGSLRRYCDESVGSWTVRFVCETPPFDRSVHCDGSNPVLVGRSPATELRLKLSRVSRVHCQVFVEANRLLIVDEGSARGTKKNGTSMPPDVPHSLEDGDVLDIAEHRFTVFVTRNIEHEPSPPE